MMNFFNKTMPLLAASVLAATTAFAQDNSTNRQQKKCFDQGLEMPANQTMAGHSHHARTEVRGSWDVGVKGSYLYWQARQENMDLGFVSNSATNPGAAVGSSNTVEHPDFAYKSGFKVALALNLDYDHWATFGEYTWFHGTTTTSITESAGNFIYPSQGYPLNTLTAFTSANQSWNLKMDFADLSLARSYYSGSKLVMVPFFGARGAWIRQNEYNAYDSATESLTTQNKSISQGVGPRVGVNTKWQLGYGFRLKGDTSFDILYTRYNFLLNQVSSVLPNSLKINEKHNDFLRAHADLELGFGWGSYFDNNNWFVDVSATYGFQVFWDQNMFRSYSGTQFGQGSIPNGNLYIHGLTANLRLDF